MDKNFMADFKINGSFKITIPFIDSNFNFMNYFKQHVEPQYDGITTKDYHSLFDKYKLLLRHLKSLNSIITDLENENSQLGQDMAILKLENCRLQSQLTHLTQTPHRYSRQDI